MQYTEEQIIRANQTDIVSFLSAQGEQLGKSGKEYRWKKHDSVSTSLYDLMGVMGDRGVLCACMEPGYVCRWQDEHGRCAIHCQLAALQRKQDEAFRAVSLCRLLTGGSDSQDTSEL